MKKLVILLAFIFSLNNQAQENSEQKKAEIEKRRAQLIEKKAEIEKRRAQLIEKREEILANRKEMLQEKKDKIKSLKIAFISQKLALTSEVAEKFWPVYNKYDDKIMALKEAQMKLRVGKKNGTDEEALKKIEEAEAIESEVMLLKKKMRAELIPIITAEKVVALERLEHEFHRKILEKLKGRKGNHPPPPPRR
ncbi:hypothetical protein [Flavobacterium sp.]|jgi:hypothetical protein|uniref:hypothetical protein n=1 Tax=Flavobacterium sp. TaxID=239 RepID=UPI0037C14CD2